MPERDRGVLVGFIGRRRGAEESALSSPSQQEIDFVCMNSLRDYFSVLVRVRFAPFSRLLAPRTGRFRRLRGRRGRDRRHRQFQREQ